MKKQNSYKCYSPWWFKYKIDTHMNVLNTINSQAWICIAQPAQHPLLNNEYCVVYIFLYSRGSSGTWNRYLELGSRSLRNRLSGGNLCLLLMTGEKLRDFLGIVAIWVIFGGLPPKTRCKWQHEHWHMPMHMQKCIETEISPSIPFQLDSSRP